MCQVHGPSIYNTIVPELPTQEEFERRCARSPELPRWAIRLLIAEECGTGAALPTERACDRKKSHV